MSTFYSNGLPTTTEPQRPRKKRRIIPALIFAGGCLLGFTVGTAGSSAPAEPAASEPVPAPTVTETVEVKVPGPVETKTVEVPGPATVPPTCTTALDYADEGFTLASEIMSALQAGISSGDFSAADAGNEKMSALAPKYNATKAACRLAAEK